MEVFDPKKLEAKWNGKWKAAKVCQPFDFAQGGATDTYYNLMMFPYPSAEGLHVGNMYAFTGSDVWGRYQRMQGKMVFEPIGLDGFGIHSENYAIKVGRHPKEHAKITEENFYRQLSEIGNGFAWDNKLETYDPEYYRWTQWIFVKLFKAGLAYRKKAPVNWCPSCKTVLADEQVIDGLCERCSSQVEDRDLEQWFFRITKYADRLLDNLTKIDWDNKVKVAQRNWIGRKEGIVIRYQITDIRSQIEVFTTTPVNFGATFLVVSPEHPLVASLDNGEVKRYVQTAKDKTDQERIAQGQEKTGVFTGLYVVNHVTREKIPVWVSDFVLAHVGTGAIQGCPGHDKRDFEFAKKFGVPIKRVVVGPDGDTSEITKLEQVIESGMPGKMVNSDFLNGVEFSEAMKKTMDYFEKQGWGKRVKTYHLRDWLISRQRYWGPPIPMIFCPACEQAGRSWGMKNEEWKMENDQDKKILNSQFSILNSAQSMRGWYPVPEDQLPVVLPDLEDFKPTGDGRAPLERAPQEWLEVACPECRGAARRETDVSDTFLDSAWYFLRYPSVGVKNSKLKIRSLPWDPDITLRWLPVDMYIGGAEHSVMHLLYARFVTMALYDLKLLQFEEPFTRFRAHGLIIKDGAKMSKSKGNVVNPDEYIAKYGADTLRAYLMFVGPLRDGGDFRDTGMAGMYRFLERVWNTFSENSEDSESQKIRKPDNQRIRDSDTPTIRSSDAPSSPPAPYQMVLGSFPKLKYIGENTSPTLKRKLHWAIKRATEGVERLKYNTAIAAVMELINLWRDLAQRSTPKAQGVMSRDDAGLVLRLLAPFAPYLAEELWSKFLAFSIQHSAEFSRENSIHVQSFPTWEEAFLKSETVSIVVQVNGKVRGVLQITDRRSQITEETVTRTAKEDEKIKPWIVGKEIKKTVWVPGKLINLVTN